MPSSHDPFLTDAPTRTALVLGGGGSAGNAWLIGILAGLADGGLDVTDADLTVGTSAGATAAAQVSAASPEQLYADILSSVFPARPAGGAPTGAQRPGGRSLTANHLDRMRATIAASDGIADLRRRMGRELDTEDAVRITAQWRETVAARLPGAQWPERRLILTAVDAATGEPVLFDRASGVSIVDAVAASTAGGFAYGIGDGRYIDGGYRSNADNADLASGCARILILSPLGGRSFHPGEWRTSRPRSTRSVPRGASSRRSSRMPRRSMPSATT